jgi:hypothetical protein
MGEVNLKMTTITIDMKTYHCKVCLVRTSMMETCRNCGEKGQGKFMSIVELRDEKINKILSK